jgi:hypothetical protein
MADIFTDFYLHRQLVDNMSSKNLKDSTDLFASKLDEVDLELKDYKQSNKINEPIYSKYKCWIAFGHPVHIKSGLHIQTGTPKEVADKYELAYTSVFGG